MARTIHNERGGFLHLFLAAAILGGIGMSSIYGQSLNTLIEGKSRPGRIATTSDLNASCAANTVDTIIGTLGCGSAKKDAHLSRITLVSTTAAP